MRLSNVESYYKFKPNDGLFMDQQISAPFMPGPGLNKGITVSHGMNYTVTALKNSSHQAEGSMPNRLVEATNLQVDEVLAGSPPGWFPNKLSKYIVIRDS